MRPYRYDIVGSFLRPDDLKEARKQYRDGKLTREELTQAENRAIRELAAKEKEAGLHAVTDGELKRRCWHLDFLSDLEGVQEVRADKWSEEFKGLQPKAAALQIVGKIDFNEDSVFLKHFDFLKETAGD